MYKLIRFFSRIISMLLIRKHRVKMGSNVEINGVLKLGNQGSIEIGNGVIINSGAFMNPVYGDRRTVLATKPGARIQIGDHTGISNSLLFAAESITIENDVLIGGGCSICDTDFHPTDYQLRIQNDVKAIGRKPIVIKEGAFIGMNSIILKGVTVGRHSIVGAGSVVTKDIPAGEIWAGNPAKYIQNISSKM